jgi:C-terminal processing protease CtpA/Prc
MSVELMEVKRLIEQNTELIKSIISKKDTDCYLTVEEAASYAKISTQTIHRNKIKIGYSQPDRKVIIKKSDLIAWIDNFRTQKIS